MTIKKINHISDLPNWYELDKYEATNHLDALGWYEQLKARSILKLYIDISDGINDETRETDNEIFNLIHETPIIDTTKNELLRSHIGIGDIESLKNHDYETALGVHMLTVREMYFYHTILRMQSVFTLKISSSRFSVELVS